MERGVLPVGAGVIASVYAAATAQLRGSLADATVVLIDAVETHGAPAVVEAVLLACGECLTTLAEGGLGDVEELGRLLLEVAYASQQNDLLPRMLAASLAEIRADYPTRDLLLGGLEASRVLAVVESGAATVAAILRWQGDTQGADPVELGTRAIRHRTAG